MVIKTKIYDVFIGSYPIFWAKFYGVNGDLRKLLNINMRKASEIL